VTDISILDLEEAVFKEVLGYYPVDFWITRDWDIIVDHVVETAFVDLNVSYVKNLGWLANFSCAYYSSSAKGKTFEDAVLGAALELFRTWRQKWEGK